MDPTRDRFEIANINRDELRVVRTAAAAAAASANATSGETYDAR